MKKLFMVGVGGDIEGATIEVHDIQFVVAKDIEGCFEELKRKWYGIKESLHIDSYRKLEYLDGLKIDLEGTNEKLLYMVTYGGEEPSGFGESHEYCFLLAYSLEDAKKLAKDHLPSMKGFNHIDKVICVNKNINASLGFVEGDYKYNSNKAWQGYIKL